MTVSHCIWGCRLMLLYDMGFSYDPGVDRKNISSLMFIGNETIVMSL
jgi:hypothetical protein